MKAMPFRSTNPNDPLPTDPEVRIFFDGLLLLRPSGINCEILVVSHVDHVLTVDVFEDHAPPNVPILRFAGPLQDPLQMTTNAAAGVMAFRPTDQNDPHHFHWALDMHAQHAAADVDNSGVQRKTITVFDGVLSSALRSAAGVSLRKHIDPSQCMDRGFVASLLTTDIKLNGRQFSIVADTSIPLPTDNGQKYLIYVSNTRSAPGPPTGGIGDLNHYYHALRNVNPADELDLFFRRCGTTTRDTTRVPCMSVIFDV